MSYLSNCCGAEMHDPYLDMEICPICKEHCGLEFIPEEELIKGSINGLEESKYENT